MESLKKINYSNYQIILIDNGSKDKDGDRLKKKFPFVHLMKNKENLGFCKANNQGMKFALRNGVDYVLLLNNDTVVDKDFLNVLVDYAEQHPEVGAVSPRINYYRSEIVQCFGGTFVSAFGSVFPIKKVKENRIIHPDVLSGCALFIRSEVVKKVGFLDDIFFAYMEDIDYCVRIKDKGYLLAVIPQSLIWHKQSSSAGIKGTSKVSSLQAYLRMRNALYFIRRREIGFRKFFLIFSIIFFQGLFLLFRLNNKKDAFYLIRGIRDGISRIK